MLGNLPHRFDPGQSDSAGNRRFSKGYEYKVQTSETLIAIAAIRLMLDRLAAA